MKKIRCLISAGPTREHFDPVRFISNPSTGKMGIAIAKAAKMLGWQTTLILGPTLANRPEGIEIIDVVSAQDMLQATLKHYDNIDILIMTAAVSDMRPKQISTQKVKKESLSMNLEFEPTPDILKTLSRVKKNQILIGFAAETNNVISYAQKKLAQKNLDAIAANSVARPDSGFASDFNAITLILKSGEQIALAHAPKDELATKLVDILNKLYFQ